MQKLRIFIGLLISGKALIAQVPVMSPISGPSVVCSAPAMQTFSTSATNAPTSYYWAVTPSSGVYISNSSAATTSISFPGTNTTYTISCAAGNSSGPSQGVSMVITVFQTPIVTFSGGSKFCQGSSTNIQASPTAASSTISYSWTPATGLSATNIANPIAGPATTTTYTVNYSAGSCSNTAQVTVSVFPNPLLVAGFTRSVICTKETTTLLIAGLPTNQYYLNNVPVIPPQITYTGNTTGVFTYTVKVVDANTCSLSAVEAYTVSACTGIDNAKAQTDALLVYPNPSNNGTFFITTNASAEVLIMDQLGRITRIIPVTGNKERIVTGLPPGIYYILAGSERRKLIISQ